ncbi:MAG: T9SS C-terminal target domain-containing protein [Bacteroidetes bacterium]|nr:MAG: T9SS C-terminal target domain-containing protein [Bacteroidota bacterium]
MKPQLLLQKSTLIKFLLILYIGIFGIAKAQVSVTGITLYSNHNVVALGNNTEIYPYIEPNNATNRDVSYIIEPSNAGSISNNTFVSITTGVVTITATSVSNPTVSGIYILTVLSNIPIESINLIIWQSNTSLINYNETVILWARSMPSYSPDSTLTWEISDNSLGSLSIANTNTNGMRSFTSNTITGIVTVTARSVSNPSVSEKIVISINDYIPITGLYLQSFKRVNVNIETYLGLRYTPNNTSEKSIIWTVEPSNLGYIDGSNNFIAGSIPGIVTITATSASNSNIKSTTIIEISLVETYIINELESVVIETQLVTSDGSNLTITMMTISGVTTYCFKYSTDPLFQTNVVTVCGLAFPRYTISFSFINGRTESKNLYWQIGAVDANGNTYWSSTQRYESVTSISNTESANSRKIEVHPNPGTDFIHIEGLKPNESISIFDLSGKLMLIDTKSDLDIKDLHQGIYIIKVANKVSKFIKL